MSEPLTVTSSVLIPGEELEWTAVRSGGPGGQNVNKVATKVELRFDVEGSSALGAAAKARLLARVAGRLDAEGRLLVTCDETRSQPRNLELARQRLAELVRAALVVPKKRRATRPTRASRERRLEAKRQIGEKKRERKGEW
jgi:ribosome-associated protein